MNTPYEKPWRQPAAFQATEGPHRRRITIVEQEGRAGDPGFRAHVADLMLRYSLYTPEMDRLILAMRKPEWVAPNLESVGRGPLCDDERAWLLERAGSGAA